MSTLSAHVLDSALGRPAVGLTATLDDATTLVTDHDGRLRFGVDLAPGRHLLTFATGDWFTASGREAFYPAVPVSFEVGTDEHYHVALLLAPWSYTTYRGS